MQNKPGDTLNLFFPINTRLALLAANGTTKLFYHETGAQRFEECTTGRQPPLAGQQGVIAFERFDVAGNLDRDPPAGACS